MSPNAIDNLPLGTIAAILDDLANSRWPRQDKPAIASRYGLTIADLQVLLKRYGCEELDPERMKNTAAGLRRAEQIEQAQDIAGDDADVSRETDPDQPDPGPRQKLIRVRIDQLRADPNNLREHIAHKVADDELDPQHGAVDDIDQLADSIRESGLHQPIVVRQAPNLSTAAGVDLYMVVMGHRRLAALRRLKWTTTEVVVRPPMSADEVLAAMLIENGQRAGLDPIEEARGIRQLGVMHGWTDERVAQKIGRSKSYVSMRLALLDLSVEDQQRIRNREMGVTAGANLGRLNSGRTQQSAKGHRTVDYFGPTNDLAARARARHQRLKASGSHQGKVLAGGEACGECWESVIRADERSSLQTANANVDNCVTCNAPLERGAKAAAL